MKIFKYFFILILIMSYIISSEITERTETQIKDFFPNLISLDWSMHKIEKESQRTIQNTVRQKFFRKEVNTWILIDSDSSKYYAILDNVKGKSLPITFLAIYNQEGNLHTASVIKYREAYGGEVGNSSWLNQFTAFNDTSSYKVGDEVSAISGATISVNSISKGFHKLSMLIKEIIIEHE